MNCSFIAAVISINDFYQGFINFYPFFISFLLLRITFITRLFRPKILLAIFNITADKTTNPKILLQKMVDVLRTGELRTHEEPVASRLTVDVRGFKFLNNQGKTGANIIHYKLKVV